MGVCAVGRKAQALQSIAFTPTPVRGHGKMEDIHHAAWDGDVAAIDRLVAEDGRRLNARIQWDAEEEDDQFAIGCSPLMLAAWNGQHAAVARLLALGADVGLKDAEEYMAVHLACGGHSCVLNLLLDAGASIDARTGDGRTPLMQAASNGHTRCVALLIDRGGDALDLNAVSEGTALYKAANNGSADIVQLLLQVGADPSIRDCYGDTALERARINRRQPCIALLEAALVEPQRTRAIFKARTLIDIRRTVAATAAALARMGLPTVLQRAIIAMTVPPYLVGCVAQAQELPRVSIQQPDDAEEEKEKLAACVKYALWLEGGGVVLAEGQEPTVGMVPEVLVELLEMMVPKWDPAGKGRPLGEGYIEEPEEEEQEEEEVEIGCSGRIVSRRTDQRQKQELKE